MFKKLFCKHEYGVHGLTYVKCKICGKVKQDSKLAGELITNHCNAMVNKGIWDKDDVGMALALRLVK